MSAYSDRTNRSYPSWDDLVAAESNGYVVVLNTVRANTVPAVYGPYADKGQARSARTRLRRDAVREEAEYGVDKAEVRSWIRVLWKDQP